MIAEAIFILFGITWSKAKKAKVYSIITKVAIAVRLRKLRGEWCRCSMDYITS